MFIPRKPLPYRGWKAAQGAPTLAIEYNPVKDATAAQQVCGEHTASLVIPGDARPIDPDSGQRVDYREFGDSGSQLIGSRTSIIVRLRGIRAARKLESAAAYRRFHVAAHDVESGYGQLWFTVWGADSATLDWLSSRPWVVETREIARQLPGTGSSQCAPLPRKPRAGKAKKPRWHGPSGQRIPDCSPPKRIQGECRVS